MGQEISRAHSRGYNDGLGGGTYIGQSLATTRLLLIMRAYHEVVHKVSHLS